MKKSTWWVIGIVVVVVIAIIISGRSKSVDKGAIKIGMITPLSGNVGALGEIMKSATQFAVDDVNSAGGINGRSIEILYEDDQCNPSRSVSAIQKLTDIDKVKTVIASSCSGSVMAMIPVAEKNNTFIFSGGATSPDLRDKSRLFARTISSDSGEVQILAEMAITKGWKKIGVLHESSDYALASYQYFVKFYGNNGTIINEEYPTTTTDFRSVLLKIKNEKPDAIFIIPQSPATGARILNNMTQLKWSSPVMVAHVIAGAADLVAQNKAILEGAFAAEPEAATNDKSVALENRYKEKYGKELDYKAYFQAQYDLVRILADGFSEVGNDPEKLAAWVRTVKDYNGVSGILSIDSGGDRTGGHVLKVIKDGKPVTITP